MGHADAPVQIPVPGSVRVLSVEYRTSAPQISVESLARLREDGAISRRELHRLTRTVTVVDPEALQRETGRNPGLAHRLRGAWRTGTATIAVHLRAAKTA